MNRFLKPLYHSDVFWYGVLCVICCGMWVYLITRLASYNNSSAWMALAMVLIFVICTTFSVLMLNGVELTEDYFILRHGLALRQPIAIAYDKITSIELCQRGQSQIQLRLITTDGRRIKRTLALTRKADRTNLCNALQQKGITCRLCNK